MKRYIARYPSGRVLSEVGQFFICAVNDHLMPCLLIGERVAMFDQRAIIVCESDGVVVYSPRRYRDGLSKEMQEWLDEHPEWDPLNRPVGG